jgi:hypothetical protein
VVFLGERKGMGVNTMLSVCCLLYQPFDASDDVATALFDWELVIVIPFNILESVKFPPRDPDHLEC